MSTSNTTSALDRCTLIPDICVSIKPANLPKEFDFNIQRSSDVVNALRTVFNPDTIEWCEYFIALYLNMANKVIGHHLIGIGGLSGVVADPRKIAQLAILTNASGVIISHNHPSGNLNPSKADISLTQKVKEGLSFFDIKLLDHIILAKDTFYSFADEGCL